MKYLPFEKYTLTSPLSVHEIKRRVALNIEEKKIIRLFSGKGPRKPYEGYVHNDTFRINRIIDNRNSFLPFITGYISETGNGTQVKIIMRMAIYTMVVMGSFVAILGSLFCIILFNAILDNEPFDSGQLVVMAGIFVMLSFGYLLAILSFKRESKRSKKFLIKLLEPKPAN